MQPQTWVEIDLIKLVSNLSRFAACFPVGTNFIPVIKKEAYGHGLIEVARFLESSRVTRTFGVATAEEAVRLRRAGIGAEILCLSVLRGEDLREALLHGTTLTVTGEADAGEASSAARRLGVNAYAHLKIDTGMTRLGQRPADAMRMVPAILSLPHLAIEGISTHLADAWGDPAWGSLQAEALFEFIQSSVLEGRTVHIGGSDGLALAGKFPFGAIRPGIAMYGYHPGVAGLEPAMTMKTLVIHTRDGAAGARVSYGGTDTLQHHARLALAGAGYGNGYPRLASGHAEVLIRGGRCRVRGRVCMDQVIVDLDGLEGIEPGEEVVMFGTQGDSRLGADEVAGWAQTIAYEVLCLAGQINPRVYVGGM